MVIDILMTTDHNYISQLKVAIYSVCVNTSKNQPIFFTIFCDNNLDQISKNRVAILENIFSNITIKFYEIDLKDFKNVKSDYRVPVTSCYRLIAAKVLNGKKAIYLDSDLIVGIDIKELYEIDIEKYYVAGVRDLYPIMKPNFALWYSDNFNLKDFSDYINCGVLLMNLELMRKDDMVNKFLREIEKKNLWLDQDVINRICHGKIYLLDWKFNRSANYSDEEYRWNYKPSTRKNINEIVHFYGPSKPWENLSLESGIAWWNMAKDILEDEEYEELYRTALVGNGLKNIAEIVSKCSKIQTIIIAGYSDLGIIVKNALLKYGITGNILFCDNNKKKRELILSEQKIYCPEELIKDYKEAVWINVVQEKRNEVTGQLKDLGISETRIINYVKE